MKLNDPENFAEAFLTQYLANGLGGLAKRDTEVLVLHLLLADGRYNLPEDIYRACRELKLTETRLRSLYEAVQLKHQPYTYEEVKERLVQIVASGSIETKGDKLVFIIRDPLLRQHFEEWVAAQHGFTDSSFNKNLVVVSRETFAAVLDHLAVEDLDTINALLPSELSETPDDTRHTRSSFIQLFVDEFAKSAGKQGGSISVQTLATGLRALLMGGLG